MSIKEIQNKGRTVFEVRIKVRSKVDPSIFKEREGKAHSLVQAERLELRLRKEASEYVASREHLGQTWGQIVDSWELALLAGRGTVHGRQVLSTTIQDNIAILRSFTNDWMKRPAASISRSDVRQVYNRLADKGLSYSRIRALKSAIRSAFNWAILEDKIVGLRISPTEGVPFGVAKQGKPPLILTKDDLVKLLESARAASHEWFPHWSMASLTGMRSGELFALRWSDIDLASNLINVSRSYNGRLKREKCPKNGDSRKVPINTGLRVLLDELRAANHDSEFVLPRVGYWRRGEAAKPLRAFCAAIGVPSITFHTLRACFATHLLQAGASVPTVQAICGWKEIDVMNRYVRLAGIDVAGGTDALDYLRPSEVMGKVVVNMIDYRLAILEPKP